MLPDSFVSETREDKVSFVWYASTLSSEWTLIFTSIFLSGPTFETTIRVICENPLEILLGREVELKARYSLEIKLDYKQISPE